MLDKESKKELWKVTKDYSALTALDQQLRPFTSGSNVPKLPERALFQSNAPSRVDTRKLALEKYFFTILELPNLPPPAARALCEFLSTDMIDPMDIPDTPSKREGYLMKRGKKIRGWKVRYFVIEESWLNYYDKPEGELQGSISLINAKLGRQTNKAEEEAGDESTEKSYRHAFLLVEQKKKDHTKHILCAESDEDRDMWIQVLMEVISQVTPQQTIESLTSSPKKSVKQSPHLSVDEFYQDSNGKLSTVSSPSTQATGNTSTSTIAPTSSPGWSKNKSLAEVISSPTDLRPTASFDEDDESINKDARKHKMKGFFMSFRKNNGNSNNSNNLNPPPLTPHTPVAPETQFDTFQSTPYSAVEQQPMTKDAGAALTKSEGLHALGVSLEESIAPQSEGQYGGSESSFSKGPYGDLPGAAPIKRVFGVPLAEAVSLASKNVHHCKVPAIVYRCIEHLKMRDAIFEEGIFRLSGSTATIRTLKDRFNREYDVDLVKSETFYDIHAVAGLLKLYLREIPTLVLSSYLAPEFREAVDIQDPTLKVLRLKSLVHELPRENRDLLCVLCSLLTEIIANSEINKMNLRNVGIVFAPTLNISAYVLIHFLTDFDAIFSDIDEIEEYEHEDHTIIPNDSGSEYSDNPDQNGTAPQQS